MPLESPGCLICGMGCFRFHSLPLPELKLSERSKRLLLPPVLVPEPVLEPDESVFRLCKLPADPYN